MVLAFSLENQHDCYWKLQWWKVWLERIRSEKSEMEQYVQRELIAWSRVYLKGSLQNPLRNRILPALSFTWGCISAVYHGPFSGLWTLLLRKGVKQTWASPLFWLCSLGPHLQTERKYLPQKMILRMDVMSMANKYQFSSPLYFPNLYYFFCWLSSVIC